MGYVPLAFVALPAGGGRAAIFYVVAYAAAGLSSFGAVSILPDGSDRDAIEQYRGLGYRNPLAGSVLAVALFSLAGIPPQPVYWPSLLSSAPRCVRVKPPWPW